MKTFSCVCLPDKKSEKTIREITKNISDKCGSKKALQFSPHFTIFGDFKVEDENIDKFFSEIQNSCIEFSEIKLEINKYGFYPWKIIFLDIEKNDVLQELHDKCVRIIGKYKTSWIPDVYKDNDNFTGKQREYINKYGYHFCFEFFSSHFTVAGNDMTEKCFQDIEKELRYKRENIIVKVGKLAFFDRDNNNDIFKEILFSKN